jgi:hypothetical protein
MTESTNTTDVTDVTDATELLQKLGQDTGSQYEANQDEANQGGGKKRKQTRGKKAKKGKKSKKAKKGKKSKKAKKVKKAKTAKRSGKKNYLSFCASYAKKHGFPNARAVMKNPQCKAAFHAQ